MQKTHCLLDRYLLVEDSETGDVLMPLFYLKKIFNANYSRKLANLQNRLVQQPAGVDFGRPDTVRHLYWLCGLESPPNIKDLVRKKLGAAAVRDSYIYSKP